MTAFRTWWREWFGAFGLWMAGRSARNRTLVDRLCRRMMTRVLEPPGEDFMRDPIIDAHEGFDPDELERYQRGERIEPRVRAE